MLGLTHRVFLLFISIEQINLKLCEWKQNFIIICDVSMGWLGLVGQILFAISHAGVVR